MKRKMYLTNEHPDRPGSWSIADLSTGKVISKFGASDKEKFRAMTIMADQHGSLTAAATDGFTPWRSDGGIAFVGIPTSDKRVLSEGGEKFRDLPMPLMLQTETQWGHQGAVIAGRMDTIGVEGNRVVATGVYDDQEDGIRAARLAQNQMMNGVSIDLGEIEVEMEVLDVDEDGWPIDWIDNYVVWEVIGLTQTPFPAFADARIVVVGDGDVEEEGEDEEPIAASAVVIPVSPPVEWFEDPGFQELTAWTITDEGRIMGHIAAWGECHIGKMGSCVTPPPSEAEYSYFTTGYVQCEEECHIPTGVITLGGGHAPLDMNAREAAAHYDDSGYGVADVAVGEDQFGPWIAGALRPGVTPEQIRELRASAPSGDWRLLGGNLELVAVLAVNVGGFPVPRARTASGQQTALVAAVAPKVARQSSENIPMLAPTSTTSPPVS